MKRSQRQIQRRSENPSDLKIPHRDEPKGDREQPTVSTALRDVPLSKNLVALCRQHDILTLGDLAGANLAHLVQELAFNAGQIGELADCVRAYLPPNTASATSEGNLPLLPYPGQLFRPTIAIIDPAEYHARLDAVMARYPLRWITDVPRSRFETDSDAIHDLTLDAIRRRGFRATQQQAGWNDRDAQQVHRLISEAVLEILEAFQHADRTTIDRSAIRKRLVEHCPSRSIKVRSLRIWNGFSKWCLARKLPYHPVYPFAVGQYFSDQKPMKALQREQIITALVTISRAGGGSLVKNSAIFTSPGSDETASRASRLAHTVARSNPTHRVGVGVTQKGYARYPVSPRRQLPANAQQTRDELALAMTEEARLSAHEIVSIHVEKLRLTKDSLSFTVCDHAGRTRDVTLSQKEHPRTHRLCGRWINIADLKSGPLIRNMRNAFVYDFGLYAKSLMKNLKTTAHQRFLKKTGRAKPSPKVVRSQ